MGRCGRGVVLLLVLASMLTVTFHMQPIRAEPEQTSTGWYWPAGTGESNLWLGFMEWNPDYNGWHLAQDFHRDRGLPVYAIADGEVVLSRTDVERYGPGKTPGGALVARFETADGETFAALYGHLYNPHAEGKVEAGEVLGITKEYDHLHCGIHLGYALAANPWNGYTYKESETYGWVDPLHFLLNTTPRVIPENPSLITLPLFILSTLLAMLVAHEVWTRQRNGSKFSRG